MGDSPINASNMYKKRIKIKNPYRNDDTYEYADQISCYCYKGAKRVRRILPHERPDEQCLNEQCNTDEKLRWSVYTCGVTRALGRSDDPATNWLDLETVPSNMDAGSKRYWQRVKKTFLKYEGRL